MVRQRSAKPCTRVRFPFPPQSLHVKMPARLAQRESASLTRKRSLVQSQYRAQKPPGFECGCSAVGSASPCQGEGREFESRHPLSLKRRPTGRRFCVVGVVRCWGSVKNCNGCIFAEKWREIGGWGGLRRQKCPRAGAAADGARKCDVHLCWEPLAVRQRLPGYRALVPRRKAVGVGGGDTM